jgi:Flp pilus assembly protein TadG
MKLSNESGFQSTLRKAGRASFRAGREEGSTLYEFAMVGLLLSTMLIGIVYGGIMAYDRVVLTNAVATGVRTLATELGDANACTDATNAIKATAYGLNTSSPPLTISNPPVFMSSTGSGAGTSTCATLNGGEYAVMWASYPCSMNFPNLGINLCSLSNGNTNITYPAGPTCTSAQSTTTGCVVTVTITVSCPEPYCSYAIESARISGTG